jgi:hypothetical protein
MSKKCKGFNTFKERGEWVELQFMAAAVRKGFKVSKPWGDSSAYDVGVESGERILRVQVKSTDCRTEYGYLCQFKPGPGSKPYTLKKIDYFAAYVIPKDVWYVIPAKVLLGGEGKLALTLLPENPKSPERYAHECYREAWELLLPEGGRMRSAPKICGAQALDLSQTQILNHRGHGVTQGKTRSLIRCDDVEFYFDFVFYLDGSASDADGSYAEGGLLERGGAAVVAIL